MSEVRPVDANALKKAVNDFYDNSFEGIVSSDLITFAEAVDEFIDDAPTIEERPKGKCARQSDDYYDYYECERCGIAVGLDDIRNFCPNCGADMRGEEND